MNDGSKARWLGSLVLKYLVMFTKSSRDATYAAQSFSGVPLSIVGGADLWHMAEGPIHMSCTVAQEMASTVEIFS